MTLVAVVLFVLAEFIMHKTKPGTYLYATGSNEEAAFLAGIKIKRVKMVAYGLCGLLTAVAGLMVGARVGSGIPEVGTQFTMSSITAVFIGGISVRGGRGLVIGSFLGVLMIGELQDILNLLNVSAYYQYVILGLLLILAVSMSAKLPSIMALRKANKRVKQWGN
jgi:ribose/xylose/arabinose/galactoside ABC-type transport system permease subunit